MRRRNVQRPTLNETKRRSALGVRRSIYPQTVKRGRAGVLTRVCGSNSVIPSASEGPHLVRKSHKPGMMLGQLRDSHANQPLAGEESHENSEAANHGRDPLLFSG